MRYRLHYFCIPVCVLALSACESMNAAWDSTKDTLSDTFSAPATIPVSTTIPAPAAAAPVTTPAAATSSNPIADLQPVRSDLPLAEIKIANQAYAEEAINHGTPPVSGLLPTNYRGPTPVTLAGGKLISTVQLQKQITGKKPPLLINTLTGESTEIIPGSVWLSGASTKGKFTDDTQQHLGERLKTLTGNNRKQTLVFYCGGFDSWYAYNAALRAVNLGYRNVLWYRGGLAAWYEAGLPTVQSSDDQW